MDEQKSGVSKHFAIIDWMVTVLWYLYWTSTQTNQRAIGRKLSQKTDWSSKDWLEVWLEGERARTDQWQEF